MISVSHQNYEALELWWAVEEHNVYYYFNNKTHMRLVARTRVNRFFMDGRKCSQYNDFFKVLANELQT